MTLACKELSPILGISLVLGLKSERSVGLPDLLDKNYIRPALVASLKKESYFSTQFLYKRYITGTLSKHLERMIQSRLLKSL